MTITHAELVAEAKRRGMPGKTLEEVKAGLAQAKTTGADAALARLMLKFGRLQPDALQYVIAYAEHIHQCEAYGITRTDK